MKEIVKRIIRGLPGVKSIFRRIEKLENSQRDLEKIYQKQNKIIIDIQKQENKNKKDIIQLRTDRDKLHTEINNLRVDRDNLRKDRDNLRADRDNLRADRDKLRKDMIHLTETISNLSKQDLKIQRELEKKIMYYYYKGLLPQQYEENLIEIFYERTGKRLNLDNPGTYNEKLQWMKLYDSTPKKTELADKYLVRDYVKDKIGESYLIPLLGVWEKFEDIDFDALPDKFVLKANHGCGWNLLVQDKNVLDMKKESEKFHKWLSTNFAFQNALEVHYKNINPRIIAEEYIENRDGEIDDYKVFCFNGKAEYIMYLTDRLSKLKMVFYDREWNKMPFVYDYQQIEKSINRPDKLELMLELAEQLSEGFAHVRVDFYQLNDGSLKFGELTFTSASGMCNWNPPEYNKILGDMIVLPKV